MSIRPNLDFLRPCKREFMRGMYELFEADSSLLTLEEMRDVMIAPRGDTDRYQDNICPATESDEDMPIRKGTYLYAGHLDMHWGHFLLDSLSRLWPAFDADTPEYVKILFTADGDLRTYHPNIIDALYRTGIMDKIEFATKPLRIERLLVPERAVLPRERFSPKALPVYDAIIKSVEAEKQDCREEKNGENRIWGHRIFFSRSKLRKSSENEPESDWLEKYFAENGFEIVIPEQISFSTLVEFIRNAEVVATVSGTIPHNMIFARPDTKLWVIEKTPIVNNYQAGIDILRNLDATYVDANAQILPVDSGLGPFIIYPNQLMESFAERRGMTLPEPWNMRRKRKAMRRYIKMHRRHYNFRFMIQKWEEPEIGSLCEAYQDSYADFRAFIERQIPVTLADSLSPRLLLKRLRSLISTFSRQDSRPWQR